MNRWLFALALLLPLAGLATSISVRQAALSGASEWAIPITGYDPRDPLRGRYIQFAYAWTVEGDARLCRNQTCDLCLSQTPSGITATIIPQTSACTARVNLAASAITLETGFRPEEPPRFTSRIFVSESSAPKLEAQLREQPMRVVAMLTKDGRLVNRWVEAAK